MPMWLRPCSATKLKVSCLGEVSTLAVFLTMCGSSDCCDHGGDKFDPTKFAPRKEIANEKRPDDEPTDGETNDNVSGERQGL